MKLNTCVFNKNSSMVSVHASGVVDRGFEPMLGQTKETKIKWS